MGSIRNCKAERMRNSYQPRLKGKERCRRRPVIPFWIIFSVLLSCCWQLLFFCFQEHSTSWPAAGSVFGHQEVVCPAFLLGSRKSWELTLLLQVSRLFGLNVSLKESYVLLEKKSLQLSLLEKENAFTNWGPGECELCSFKETWPGVFHIVLHLIKDCFILLKESLFLMTQVHFIILLWKPVPFHYVVIIISLSSA